MKLRLLAALLLSLAVAACGDDDGASTNALPDSGDTPDAGGDASTDASPDAEPDTTPGPDAETPDVEEPFIPSWCESATVHRWAPTEADELEMWPDHSLTRDDAASPTGIRLKVDEDTAPWLRRTTNLLRPAFGELSNQTGFATVTGAFFRFNSAVAAPPTGADASTTSTSLIWVDLDTTPPTRIPYEAVVQDDGKDILMWALRPLRPNTRHAIVVTTDYRDAAGGCIQQSPVTRALLTDGEVNGFAERNRANWDTALDAIGLRPDDVSAMSVFTTQNDVQAIVDVARAIPTRTYAWKADRNCTVSGQVKRCELVVDVFDYRDNGYVRDADPGDRWSLPVTVWMPATGTGPWPTMFGGHGLGGGRSQANGIAGSVVPDGVVVVASDALEHGDHPTADNPQQAALNFLGLNLTAFSLDAPALRGNFEQTVLDRIQVLEAIRQNPDLDGDGTDDVATTAFGYWGVSLGGMLGSSLLALTDEVGSAVLSVAGGRLLSIVTDGGAFAQFKPVVINLVGSEQLFNRLLAVAQTLVDTADPAAWGPFVLGQRFDDALPPNVLFPVATDDDVVPPASGRALARAMGIPHVQPVALPVDLLPVEPAGPVNGNLADGERTAGFFQIDRVTSGRGVAIADHNNTPFSAEGQLQALTFLEGWLEGVVPTIIDPFAELGTPGR